MSSDRRADRVHTVRPSHPLQFDLPRLTEVELAGRREQVVHEPACNCPDCAAIRKIGEDVAEVLDYVPAASG